MIYFDFAIEDVNLQGIKYTCLSPILFDREVRFKILHVQFFSGMLNFKVVFLYALLTFLDLG